MIKISGLLFAIIIFGISVVPAHADAPQWKPLFDESSLDAFDIYIKGNPSGTFFTVTDGVIRAYPDWEEGVEAANGMLLTKEEYSNYHLRWEYRYDGRKFRERRNSGTLYHVQDTNIWPVCMEFQHMEDNGGWPIFIFTQASIKLTDGKYDPDGTVEEIGEIGEINLSEGAATADKPIGEWNYAEILVQGNRAIHMLNGQVIARVEHIKRPNEEKADWIPLESGRIAFQCEGAGIEFRNIQIQENPVGYIDTPFIPGQPWRVHDSARPQPPKAALSDSDQKPVPAPDGAVVLLDEHTYNFTNEEWILEKGILTVHRAGDKLKSQNSAIEFGDGHYHVEWSAPAEIKSKGQGRGNSGIFLMGKYEIQVLDCWDNYTYSDGITGSLYGQMPPLFNAVRKPGEWNYYDIFFKAPVFNGDELITPAYVTVMLNGVIVQNNQQLQGETQHKINASYEPHEAKLPISLQDHSNPVRFRNIWVKPLDRDVTKR